ncbi:MAG TPA: twin-arginine translocation signal domain-containing protein [Terriglobales bacterium]|jgi:hypothetical protein|nr:twin-arginine translocation signal domain-containing protein [Terriglobales bacterium]
MKENRTQGPFARNLSRRGLLTGVGVAGGGLLLGSSFPLTTFADDDEHEQSCNAGELCSSPDPIPHVNEAVLAGFGVKAHFFFPGPVEGTAAATDPTGAHPGGRDPSAIYDFKGFIGSADLVLTGTGTDLNTNKSDKYTFHTDSRFMSGVFLGTDGKKHRGNFAFI